MSQLFKWGKPPNRDKPRTPVSSDLESILLSSFSCFSLSRKTSCFVRVTWTEVERPVCSSTWCGVTCGGCVGLIVWGAAWGGFGPRAPRGVGALGTLLSTCEVPFYPVSPVPLGKSALLVSPLPFWLKFIHPRIMNNIQEEEGGI